MRIERDKYRELKAYFHGLALRRPEEVLADELASLPFQRYAPVRRQVLDLRGTVNRAGQSAGRDIVPLTCLRLRRRIVSVFEPGPPAAPDDIWVV